MDVLAHVTSFDLPTLAVALVVGLAAGLGLARAFPGGRPDGGDR